MVHVSQGLFAISAAIVLVLGSLHLAFTFSGRRFDPRDADLLARMKEVSPFITRQTTIWRAGQGFHASHSFGAMLFATVMSWVIIHLPPAGEEPFNATLQPALEVVFGGTWRIVVASIVAFWIGDFVNAYVLARMKVMTQGRWLWSRTIGSTIVGQGVDSLVFYPIAFLGVWSTDIVLTALLFNFLFKVSVEVLMTPATYVVVNALKRAEQEDFYDKRTDFTPFSLED